jgi:hypothetical protein
LNETIISLLSPNKDLQILKENQYNQKMKNKNENELILKKNSYVLLTQQAYCLISSQPNHAIFFKVNIYYYM